MTKREQAEFRDLASRYQEWKAKVDWFMKTCEQQANFRVRSDHRIFEWQDEVRRAAIAINDWLSRHEIRMPVECDGIYYLRGDERPAIIDPATAFKIPGPGSDARKPRGA
jgi:hypothetical protein